MSRGGLWHDDNICRFVVHLGCLLIRRRKIRGTLLDAGPGECAVAQGSRGAAGRGRSGLCCRLLHGYLFVIWHFRRLRRFGGSGYVGGFFLLLGNRRGIFLIQCRKKPNRSEQQCHGGSGSQDFRQCESPPPYPMASAFAQSRPECLEPGFVFCLGQRHKTLHRLAAEVVGGGQRIQRLLIGTGEITTLPFFEQAEKLLVVVLHRRVQNLEVVGCWLRKLFSDNPTPQSLFP